MSSERRTMRARLLSGEALFGLSLMIDAPALVEIAGRLGFDWIFVDLEHGALGDERVDAVLLAARSVGIATVVRVPRNAPDVIGRVLDLGATGVQIPHVNTADEARAAVRAARYHPLGERGLATGTRASDYGLGPTAAEHVARANADVLVAVQIEDAAALPHIEAIAAVPGVDVLFVGPSDLSQSLGVPGRADLPIVRDAVDDAIRRIRACGVVAGMPCAADGAPARLAMGVGYLYTHLPGVLAAGARAFLAARQG